jgi:hypothetical protein
LLLLKKLGQEKLFYISCCKGIRDPNTEWTDSLPQCLGWCNHRWPLYLLSVQLFSCSSHSFLRCWLTCPRCLSCRCRRCLSCCCPGPPSLSRLTLSKMLTHLPPLSKLLLSPLPKLLLSRSSLSVPPHSV